MKGWIFETGANRIIVVADNLIEATRLWTDSKYHQSDKVIITSFDTLVQESRRSQP